ncbi:MAG: ribulose-phosphate 3-epimerase [Ignavibacteria bacterium]
MKLLAPSILSADFSNISQEINIVETAGADLLHLDVMDGHFVPNITFGPKMVSDINKITELPLDVHLMISHPEKYISNFAVSGADWISVHFESTKHLNRLIHQIKESGCKAGVVINPATSVDALDEALTSVDYILIMSVNPGFGGQSFIESSVEKTRKLKSKLSSAGSNAFLEMDGGIGLDNMAEIKDAGIDVFVCGNSIFGSKDKEKTIREMKKIIND